MLIYSVFVVIFSNIGKQKGGSFEPQIVELKGVEPLSKQVTDVLSTCLFRDCFSSRLRTRTPKADLSL